MQLAFAPPEHVIFTNIGLTKPRTDSLANLGHAGLLSAPSIIDLLMNHRSAHGITCVKRDVSNPRAPFMHFKPNAAYYYTWLTARLLYSSFKADLMPQQEKVGAVSGPLNALPFVL